MKLITIDSLVTPDVSGYMDKIGVWENDTSGKLLFHSVCSCCPNPTRPNTTLRWTACYAWIAAGQYDWDCRKTSKHGKCITINGMGRVPTRNPNYNHDGECYAEDVLIHNGDSETWRGSMACCTVPPSVWKDFIKLFTLGETGQLLIIDKTTIGKA